MVGSLVPTLREQGLKDGVTVTTHYRDLDEESYTTRWTINPLLLENNRSEATGMNALVQKVDRISEDLNRAVSLQEAGSSSGGGGTRSALGTSDSRTDW